ncbi:MAG TPA: hypothetical protein VD761_11765 [Solirubrobacterales bacterium]|nr:hypothetical protein [Solirubrobacterales bacterium]
MKKLHLLLPLALLALVFGLVACGGSDESDEDKIVNVIETSVTGSDPADCKELATQAFLEQTELEQGAEAVKSCEASAEDTSDDPDSVEVSEVEVDGAAATANVAFTGGGFDGQVISLSLVEEDGDWKLDELTGFAKFDQEKLASAFEEAFADEDGNPQLVTCFGETIRGLSKAQAEEIVIGGSPRPIEEVAEGCIEGLEE